MSYKFLEPVGMDESHADVLERLSLIRKYPLRKSVVDIQMDAHVRAWERDFWFRYDATRSERNFERSCLGKR